MNLHEYQAKQVLASHGVSVPRGEVASNGDEAVGCAEKLGGTLWVVKAQVHAGARGKAGGIKVCKSHYEVRQATDGMIGKLLINHQTGPAGKPIHKSMSKRAPTLRASFISPSWSTATAAASR